MKNKFSQWLGITPAIVVAACVCISLSGYIKPAIIDVESSIKDINTKEKPAKKNVDKISSNNKSTLKLDNVENNQTYKDGKYIDEAEGFGGKVKVQVTVSNGKIADIEILNHSDGKEYMTKASALVGKIIKNQDTNVDVVSGATYSSKGIINAVRNALNKAVIDKSQVVSLENVENKSVANVKSKAPTVKKISENKSYKDGKYIGEADGFGGKVKVQVTVLNGKVTNIKVLSHSDGKEYIIKASALVDKIIKKQSTNVDAVSGATYSSNGIINAVRNALNKAAISTKKNNSSSINNKNYNNKIKITQKTKIKKGKFPYKDGTYLGKGEGYKGEITVALTIKKNTIDKIIIINNSDDPAFFNRAKAVLTKVVQGQTVEVDVVSGATFSSEGIIDSIKDALNEAKKATQGSVDTSVPDSSQALDSTIDDSIVEDSGKYQDGVYTGYAICFPDEYEDFDSYSLNVTVEIKQGKIIAVKDVYGDGDDYDTSNDWYINRAINGTSKYIGISEQFCSGKTDIDAVSGATCSSRGIINAVSDALKKAENGD